MSFFYPFGLQSLLGIVGVHIAKADPHKSTVTLEGQMEMGGSDF